MNIRLDAALKHIALILVIAYMGGQVTWLHGRLIAPDGAWTTSPLLDYQTESVVKDLVKQGVMTVTQVASGGQELKLTGPVATFAASLVDLLVIALRLKKFRDPD